MRKSPLQYLSLNFNLHFQSYSDKIIYKIRKLFQLHSFWWSIIHQYSEGKIDHSKQPQPFVWCTASFDGISQVDLLFNFFVFMPKLLKIQSILFNRSCWSSYFWIFMQKKEPPLRCHLKFEVHILCKTVPTMC